MALEKFERRLERFVEGSFARIFRSGLQPVEIGRRLTREMDLRRAVAPRGVLAPNSFNVLLSRPDHAKFEAIETELAKELVEVAREHAKREGYTFLGPVNVTIGIDEALRPGTLLVAGEMVPDQGTATLVLPDGRRVVLEPAGVTLGRLPDCELCLADAGVSRRHAEVRRRFDGTWAVTDLGSTNGTKVNGIRVNGERALQDGDHITVGSTTIRFEVQTATSAGPGSRGGGSSTRTTAQGAKPAAGPGAPIRGRPNPRAPASGGTGPRTPAQGQVPAATARPGLAGAFHLET